MKIREDSEKLRKKRRKGERKEGIRKEREKMKISKESDKKN
jgi:hypothetical protein